MNIFRFHSAVVVCAVALSGCASGALPPDSQSVVPLAVAPVETTAGPVADATNPTVIVLPAPAPSATVAVTSAPTVQATAAAVSTVRPAADSRPKSDHKVLGYYVPYDVTSWLTLQAQAGRLDYVGAQWASIDACGSVGSQDDRTLISFAKARGIKLMPSLLTLDPALNHRLLTDEQVGARAIDQIVSYVVSEGYDGFDLDLEGVSGEDRPYYTAFVAKLSRALRQQGKVLMAAIPAKANDATTGWAGAYDYEALGPHLDLAMLMTYDFSWSTGPPGSIAPSDWVDQVMRFATSQMPKEKVLLGVAFYGYDWNKSTGGRARALRYADGLALSKKYDKIIAQDRVSGSATFSYVARADDKLPQQDPLPALNHQITSRTPPACNKPLPTATAVPKPPGTPRPTATPGQLQEHEVWLEDARSLTARLEVADKNQVGGVGAWRLGQEDPEVWQKIEAWRRR